MVSKFQGWQATLNNLAVTTNLGALAAANHYAGTTGLGMLGANYLVSAYLAKK
jgi:hypothetical protein